MKIQIIFLISFFESRGYMCVHLNTTGCLVLPLAILSTVTFGIEILLFDVLLNLNLS